MNTITLEFESGGKPLYQQLYSHIVNEIRRGGLREYERLPSKRTLSNHLGISLNTVDTAYQMLVAEGYVQAKPRSGFAVCPLDGLAIPDPPGQESAPEAIQAPTPQWRYNFSTTSVDTGYFPFQTWARLSRDVMSRNPWLLNHGEGQGDAPLRQEIARYLHQFRGVGCRAEQVIVGAGVEYLLSLLAGLVPGAPFGVENPGFEKTARILRNSGAQVLPIGLDGKGMSAELLKKSGARVAYITPSHQFPTGVTMPVGRRTELLRWAGEAPGRYLVEDDFDSEFRFDGRPIPAMQGLDSAGRVIYLSTFSKSIAPSIRIAYMVLPHPLLERYRAEYSYYSSTVSRFEQHTLCRFLQEGHFARHVNRIRGVYRGRKDALVAALQTAFPPGRIEIIGAGSGLHLLLRVKNGMTEGQLCRAAAGQGIRITGLSEYDLSGQGQDRGTVVLGYSGMSEEEIARAVALLQESWDQG